MLQQKIWHFPSRTEWKMCIWSLQYFMYVTHSSKTLSRIFIIILITLFILCFWSHRHLTWLLLNLTETALMPAPLQFLWIGLRKNSNSRNVPSTLAYFLFVNHHTIGFFFSSFCWQIFLPVPQPCDKREIWEPHRTFYSSHIKQSNSYRSF